MTPMEAERCDLLIVGAGPTGLYAAYYAGFRGLSTVIVDSLPEAGGQITAMYPEKMIHDGRLQQALDARYAGWDAPAGQDILNGRRSLADLADEVLARNTDIAPTSGRQEVLENLVNRFCNG